MKLISWNVNGLRACLTHGFAESFAALDADIFSVQETKMQPGQADFAPEGYTEYTYSAEKKGYSGTACWCKTAPLAVTTGIGLEQHDHEGRVLTLEYPGFYLVNCYTPNSQDGLKRLDYRMEWEDVFRAYLLELDAKKPVILCGDLNVAHTEMDIKNAKTNRMSAGFTDQERAKMTELLAAGFADSFRGEVQLVELPLPRAGKERGLAHRLFYRFPAHCRPHPRRRDPQRDLWLRPLPGGAADRPVI